MLLDTLLGRAHTATGKLIDTLIWVDTPPDIALARKIGEAAGRARATPARRRPSWAGWIPISRHYTDFIAGTYAVQSERVRPAADIIMDGRAPVEQLADEAMVAILQRIDLFAKAGDPRATPIEAPGRRMLSLDRGAELPVRMERSAKFGDGEINEDRFLAIVHKDSLGPDARSGLARIARALALPEAMLAMLSEHLGEAEIVHFGYEGGKAGLYKIYVEFSGRVRRGLAKGAVTATNWSTSPSNGGPSDPQSARVSRYFWPAEARGVRLSGAGSPSCIRTVARCPSVDAAFGMIEAAARTVRKTGSSSWRCARTARRGNPSTSTSIRPASRSRRLSRRSGAWATLTISSRLS